MSIVNADYSNLNHEEMAKAIGLKAKHIPMLVGSFLEEANPILVNLDKAIDSRDYSAIRSTAHSIKGSAGNLRFTEVYDMSKAIELAAAESNSSFDYCSYYKAIKDAVSTISF